VRAVLFDHIAIAMPRLADAEPILAGQLGGRSAFGATTDEYRFWHWRYEGGGDLEVLEPAGENGFLHRFLAQRGPGIHHVTFTPARGPRAIRSSATTTPIRSGRRRSCTRGKPRASSSSSPSRIVAPTGRRRPPARRLP